jgi:hypothetical protein
MDLRKAATAINKAKSPCHDALIIKPASVSHMTFILLSLTHPTEFGNLMRSEYQRGCVAWDEMNEVKGGHRLGLMSVQPRVLFINEKTYPITGLSFTPQERFLMSE